MRILGRDQAIKNLMKWIARDEWAPHYEQVFAEHLDPILEEFGLTPEQLTEVLGESFDMLYGVILEDFFSTRYGDDGELNVIDDYLKRRGWREKVQAKRYLEGVRDSVISLYEVVSLDPGNSMTVRDLIRGGDPVTVEEKMGSQTAAPWDRIAARLVMVNNTPCFTGGMLLLSHEASNTFLSVFGGETKAVGSALRRDGKEDGGTPDITLQAVNEIVLETSGPRLFTQAWLVEVFGQLGSPLPEVQNTDGHDIMFSEVRFPIVGRETEIVAAIDGINDVERNAPATFSWTWHAGQSRTGGMVANRVEGLTFQSVDDKGRVTLGSIDIQSGVVVLDTNSRERAEKGRDLLASYLGDLVGPPLIVHEDLEQALDRPSDGDASEDNEIPPEIAAQLMRDYFDDHYRRTLEEPLPILDGKTPRQAVKTKKGRAKVVEWLKYLENSEHRRAQADGQEPYDMAWMWLELKLERI